MTEPRSGSAGGSGWGRVVRSAAMASRFDGVAAWLAAGVVLAAVSPASAAAVEHDGDALVQVEGWPDEVHALGLDVWTHRTEQRGVLARVTPEQWPRLLASGLRFTVVEPDIGPALRAEQARLTTAPAVLGGGLDPAFFSDYRDLSVVLERLATLAATRPDRVSVVEVGSSLEGRPIRGVRVTNPGGPDDRPVVLVNAAQHAREWITVSTAMYVAERFATAADGSALDGLLDDAELVVVPVSNPDGYVYSWEVERLWRKNRRDGVGVDLNRNWGVQWGGEGASDEPDAGNYHGTAPFSEPEAVALRDFIAAETDLLAMLDVHAFGQLVLYPWGYASDDAPDDARFGTLAQQLSDALWGPYGEFYTPVQSADLYPAAGNAVDWAYGAYGVHAMAIEQRPTGESGWGFVLPPEQILPTGEELLAAVATLIESTVALGPGLPGDSGGMPLDTGDSEGGASTTGDSTTGPASTGPTTSGPGGADDTTGDPTTGSPPPPLPGGTAGETTASGASGSETGGEAPAAGGDAGCGCRAGGGDGSGWGWLGLLMTATMAVRRSSSPSRHPYGAAKSTSMTRACTMPPLVRAGS